jgi:two-component system, NarL family, response regulator LiaR
MSQSISLVVVDDDQVVAECVGAICESLFGAEVLGFATNGEDGLALMERVRPQIALLDLSVPLLSSIEVIAKASERHFPTRCIVLTGSPDQESCITAMRAGAAGYLLKASAIDELTRALQAVSEGKTYVTPRLKDAVDHLTTAS